MGTVAHARTDQPKDIGGFTIAKLITLQDDGHWKGVSIGMGRANGLRLSACLPFLPLLHDDIGISGVLVLLSPMQEVVAVSADSGRVGALPSLPTLGQR